MVAGFLFLASIGSLVLASVALGPPIVQELGRRRAYARLGPFAGRRVDALRPRERDHATRLVRELTGGDAAPGEAVWWIWRLPESDGDRLVVFEAGEVGSWVGGTTYGFDTLATVHVLGPGGSRLSRATFDAGWLFTPDGVSLARRDGRGPWVLEIASEPDAVGAVSRQFYSLAGDELVLVRIEDHDGAPSRVVLGPDRIGPAFPERSEDEWERAIVSGDWAETLRSLLWLTAVRRVDDGRAARVRARAKVARALERYASEGDVWVRDGAKLALAK
jgi:hypothetical protein